MTPLDIAVAALESVIEQDSAFHARQAARQALSDIAAIEQQGVAGISPDESAEYHRGWKDGCKHGAWIAKPASTVAGEAVAWQPIETAPQDGYMLVHEDGALRALLRVKGRWQQAAYPAIISHPWGDVIVGEDAKRLLPEGYRLELRDGCCENPTDWMPMPPVPGEQPPSSAQAVRDQALEDAARLVDDAIEGSRRSHTASAIRALKGKP